MFYRKRFGKYSKKRNLNVSRKTFFLDTPLTYVERLLKNVILCLFLNVARTGSKKRFNYDVYGTFVEERHSLSV